MAPGAEAGPPSLRTIASTAALVLAVSIPARADPFGDDLERFMYDDATATIHVRSYFLDRINARPPNNAAWAGGGWVGYQSGWLLDSLRVGAVGYTSQPLWAPANTGGTLLLLPGQYGYWVLGQAYASLRFYDQAFTAYRQLIDELEVNPHDNRMTPATFEAYAMRGAVGPLTYFAGYIASIKKRDSTVFVNMAAAAGAPANVTAAGMWLGSLRYAVSDGLKLRTSIYNVPNVLTSSYSDGEWLTPLFDGFKLKLAANFMVQGSNGANQLTGQAFSTFSTGARSDFIWGPATLAFAYTQTGSAAAYRAPYGLWMGYTRQLTFDFDRAGERAFKVEALFDFARLGLQGLALGANVTIGNGAINAATGAPLANNTEYNFDLQYRLTADYWPDWLRSLSLRGQAGRTDQAMNGVTTTVTQYRAILNYEWTFGGGKRP